MKKRVDLVLCELGHFSSREKARRAIMAGQVYLDTLRVAKASQLISPDDYSLLQVKKKDEAVSRAYYKLQKALDSFSVSAKDKICIDVGSSTGGFTQLLLQRGAAKVYAVDCGSNQLAYSLRCDPRVVVMEKTNARYLSSEEFNPLPVLAVMDVSFISVKKIIPILISGLKIQELVCLIKPQFEAGRNDVGKGGIVRDMAVHKRLLEDIILFVSENGLKLCGLEFSPIKGSKGNIEYIAFFSGVVCGSQITVEDNVSRPQVAIELSSIIEKRVSEAAKELS